MGSLPGDDGGLDHVPEPTDCRVHILRVNHVLLVLERYPDLKEISLWNLFRTLKEENYFKKPVKFLLFYQQKSKLREDIKWADYLSWSLWLVCDSQHGDSSVVRRVELC